MDQAQMAASRRLAIALLATLGPSLASGWSLFTGRLVRRPILNGSRLCGSITCGPRCCAYWQRKLARLKLQSTACAKDPGCARSLSRRQARVEATEAFYHRKKALRLSNNAAQEKVRREALDVQHSGPYNAEEHLADAYKR